LQRKAAAMADVPHDPEVAEQTSSEQIYFRYVYPAIDAARKVAPEIQLQINRTARKKDEVKKNEEALLYQIKAHPRTRGRYPECKQLLQEYYAQKRPDGLSDREWNEARLHYRPVVKQIRAVLQPHHLMFHQDKFPIQKIPLILYLRQLQNQVQKARHQ
jgi:hypothetical protein